VSISSVSSYSSTLWEEYLEQLKKKQQENSTTATEASAVDAAAPQANLSLYAIFSELQGIQEDTEKLKERAAELAVSVAKEAESSVGIRKDTLEELVSDLETVAESGDLSILQEKLAQKPGGMGPPTGPRPNGAAGISAKLIRGLVEDEDEEDDEDDTDSSYLESVKALLVEIQKLIEKEENLNASAQTESDLTPEQILFELQSLLDDPEELKARAAELASQLKSEADDARGRHAKFIENLAADIDEVAESGDLSALEEKIKRMGQGPQSPAKLQRTGISIGLEALVSKFQAIKESSFETSDSSSLTEADSSDLTEIESSIEALLSQLKSNLTDRLRAVYAQGQLHSSTVSLSG
jgi:hypothetical protein